MEITAIAPEGPQKFLKAPLRGDVRCAHGAARTDRPPVSTDPARTTKSPIFSISFSNPSKSQSRLVVACGGVRRLLEWALGAASDDHAALDGGLSARIGIPTAGNSGFSGLSSGPGRGHFSLENGLGDSRIAKFSRCARLRTWGFAPPVQGTPSRTLTPVTLGGRRHPEVPRPRIDRQWMRSQVSPMILISS